MAANELEATEDKSKEKDKSKALVETEVDGEIELPPGTIKLPPMVQGMLEMPAAKQMGLIFSFSAVFALALLIGIWSISPDMTPLYSSLDSEDAADVSSALLAAGIDYDLDTATGMILVKKEALHDARLKMAALGIPKKATIRGMEQLSEEQGFGTSQFVEAARYHHALESELARTIASLRNIRKARVHLALPKQSVFVRDRIPPSASVVVDLIGGEGINSSNVASIVHLVSSSVPHLTAQQVTVVDQNGRLLSDATDKNNSMAMGVKQYQYTRQLETDLVQRIETLLAPIIGVGKVRAEVNAEVDFDAIESTSEAYDPEKRIVRSEQTSENRKAGGRDAEGIPGALTNKPPEDAVVTENTEITDVNANDGGILNSSRNAVRNFEVDKTISHKKRSTGLIKRLTVAVLVDHALFPVEKPAVAAPVANPAAAAGANVADQAAAAAAAAAAQAPEQAAGQAAAANPPVAGAAVKKAEPKFERRELNAEELQRLTLLVQETIGYNVERGDRVNVISAPFLMEDEVEPLDVPFYEQEWFWPTMKQLAGVLLVLYIVFGVLKPSLKDLSNYRPPVVIHTPEDDEDEEEEARKRDGVIPLPELNDQKIQFAKAMVEHDPRRVAKVVKDWVSA
ncbi:MAG: flagellar basal-body MS-ring/collar protein FliF [Gammaproteobacteria bacterium]|nr:flagellar basal-body MS-ring/collar protein FliF [Gammaproteobacteria bacterium]